MLDDWFNPIKWQGALAIAAIAGILVGILTGFWKWIWGKIKRLIHIRKTRKKEKESLEEKAKRLEEENILLKEKGSSLEDENKSLKLENTSLEEDVEHYRSKRDEEDNTWYNS